MRIYLDNCCYCRPYDDQSIAQIKKETNAIKLIWQSVISGEHSLVWSFALDYEIGKIADEAMKERLHEKKNASSQCIDGINDAIKQLAAPFIASGVKYLDALHLACALNAGCDYLLTTDKRFINSAQNGRIKVVNPIQFLAETEVLE